MKVFLVALLAACFTAAFSADINEHWTRFQQTHGKFYKTSLEETLRKEVFIFNYNKIKNHNILYEQGLVSFRLKLNKFADLTSEEFNSLYNGFKRSKAIADADIIPFVPPADVDIPDAFDWRDKGAVTNIKDQEACGSCWTFSSTGALEGQYFLKNGKLASISEQNLVDCSLNDGNSGCDGGDMVPAFTYIFNNNGIDSEKSYPYEAVDGRCRYKLQGNVTTIKSISTIEKANEEHLKAAVATVGPIAVAIDASHDDFQFYDSGVYYREDCEQGLDDVNDLDHAVLAVGYGTENGKDYWLIKNSWGEGWGDEGYIKMSRNRDNNCGVATECSFPILY